VRIINQTRNVPLITRGRVANTFWLKLRGLLGATSLEKDEGIILVGEKSIHTLFMKFPIDVAYVDRNFKIIRVDTHMAPFRLGPFVPRSAYVLEMPVGTITNTATQVGDQLVFEY
jgi:uncharacterized membrane protein (UPF0127 family)